MENHELILIEMVLQMQAEQRKYFKEKRIYGNSTQQLDVCKKLEKELKQHCEKRKEILTKKQTELFS
jgi:hypothetical protein